MAQLPSQRLIKPRVGLGAPAGVGVGGETAQQLRAGVIVLPEPVLRLRRGGGVLLWSLRRLGPVCESRLALDDATMENGIASRDLAKQNEAD